MDGKLFRINIWNFPEVPNEWICVLMKDKELMLSRPFTWELLSPLWNVKALKPISAKGVRRVLMPDFYADKIKGYLESLQLNENDRIFPFTKSYLHHEIRRGCAASGVKRIRIHGIRHSHISLLIDMGFSAVAIADRVGHESIDITYRYAHVFPSTQVEVASQLNNMMISSYTSEEQGNDTDQI